MIKVDSDERERSAVNPVQRKNSHPSTLAPVSTEQLDSRPRAPGCSSGNASIITACQKASQEGPWQFSLVTCLSLAWGQMRRSRHRPGLAGMGWSRRGCNPRKSQARGHPTTTLLSLPPGLLMLESQGSHQPLSTGHQ